MLTPMIISSEAIAVNVPVFLAEFQNASGDNYEYISLSPSASVHISAGTSDTVLARQADVPTNFRFEIIRRGHKAIMEIFE